MKIKKPNSNMPVENNGKDNTVVDGYVSAEQLYANMKQAGQINLQSMYPKDKKMEEIENNIINEKSQTDIMLKNTIKSMGKKREEYLDEVLEAKKRSEAIVKIKSQIAETSKKMQEVKGKEKDKLIEQLQTQVAQLKEAKDVD